MTRNRPSTRDDAGSSMIVALLFVTGVGMVVAALLTYGMTGLTTAAQTGQAAQNSADASGSMQTAINDVRNSVYNNGGTPCLAAGDRRTYPSLVTGGVTTTVTCAPEASSGLGGGVSVPITSANRPPAAVLTLGTYGGGAMPGTLPADPSAIVVSPPSGAQGIAVLISGTNVAGATVIQIGTTAQIQTATGTSLSPCPGGVAAAGCFTTSGSNLSISSMPAHAAGVVQVKVITLGTASSGAFTYATVPSAPAAPTAAAGQESATITWVAPADGGSPITGYVITPTRNGVVQAAVTVAATPTAATFPGLTVGASYTFRVAAVNVIGTGPQSPASNAVVPLASAPDAPTIGTATARTLAAILTWTAPTDTGGSALNGYVVTPYLSGVAQPTQTFASTATTQRITGLTGGGSYTFTVSARNAVGTGAPSAASNAVVINAAMVITSPNPLPSGTRGDFYYTFLTKTGGTAPFVWSISAGSLPAGLVLYQEFGGAIAGTPTATDNDLFTLMVTDADGTTTTKVTRITITNGSPVAGPASAMDQDEFERLLAALTVEDPTTGASAIPTQPPAPVDSVIGTDPIPADLRRVTWRRADQ